MEQYIKKSDIVAELKKRFDYRVNGLKAINNNPFWDEDQSENESNAVLTRCVHNAAKNEVFELICFLDTLEVKEVDLDKMLTGFMGRYAYENGGEYPSAIDIAKHFFELGMHVSNKAQKGEEV